MKHMQFVYYLNFFTNYNLKDAKVSNKKIFGILVKQVEKQMAKMDAQSKLK